MVSLPFGVKEVMYYAAAAQWVMLCKEPVCGPDRICDTASRRVEDSTGCLNPLSKIYSSWSGYSVLDSEVCFFPQFSPILYSHKGHSKKQSLLYNAESDKSIVGYLPKILFEFKG